VRRCDFPLLGLADRDPVLVQRVHRGDGSTWVNVVNTGDDAAERIVTWADAGCAAGADVRPLDAAPGWSRTEEGVRITIAPRTACRLAFTAARRV
jgi:hypothetical protein